MIRPCCWRPRRQYSQLVSSLVLCFFQFGLVCDKAVLLETSQAVFTVGVVIGALICPWFADKYGRRPVFLFSQWGMIVFGLLTAFAPDYYTFVAARFFCGALEQVTHLPHPWWSF